MAGRRKGGRKNTKRRLQRSGLKGAKLDRVLARAFHENAKALANLKRAREITRR